MPGMNGFEMLEQTFLAGFVVIWRDLQGTIGAGPFGGLPGGVADDVNGTEPEGGCPACLEAL